MKLTTTLSLIVILLFTANSAFGYQTLFGKRRLAVGIDYIRLSDSRARSLFGPGSSFGAGFSFNLTKKTDLGIGLSTTSFSKGRNSISSTSLSVGLDRFFHAGGSMMPWVGLFAGIENNDSESLSLFFSFSNSNVTPFLDSSDNTAIFLGLSFGNEFFISDRLQTNIWLTFNYSEGNNFNWLGGSIRFWISQSKYLYQNTSVSLTNENLNAGGGLGFVF